MTRNNVVPWHRTGHGTGAGQPRIEVPPADEAARGTAAPQRRDEAEIRRTPKGRPADALSASRMGERGGRAHKGRDALADTLGLSHDPHDPYNRRAENLRRKEVRHLRDNVAGGEVSPGVRLMVKLAARQAAGAERAFDAGDDVLGTKLADSARQNLLAAHAKAAQEGADRAKVTGGRTADVVRELTGGKP